MKPKTLVEVFAEEESMAEKKHLTMTSGELGRRIREARETCGLSQQVAATRAGVSVRAWSRWETGEGMPKLSQLEKAASVLGTTAATLFTY